VVHAVRRVRTFVLIIVGITIVISDFSSGFGCDEIVFIFVLRCVDIIVIIHQTQRPIDAIG
jgi:hypothetical protein